MPWFLGIDTSNYTTSAALFDGQRVIQAKKPLPVAAGAVGLRQSDAVFAHVKQLGEAMEEVMAEAEGEIAAVGVSAKPRDEEGSYMPCFLPGLMAARSVAAALRVPLARFSHQGGHVAAALYGAGRLDLADRPFLAFHISGGTTQCLHVSPGGAPFRIETVAQSLDLHAGQAVDRVGGLLGLDFPAGPALEKLALASDRKFSPRPAFKGMDCCLSGVENQCKGMLESGEGREDVAAYCIAYLEAVVLEMTRLTLEGYPGLPLVYAGGVMSNGIIRRGVEERFGGLFAPPAYSADNAAGIAVLCAMNRREETL